MGKAEATVTATGITCKGAQDKSYLWLQGEHLEGPQTASRGGVRCLAEGGFQLRSADEQELGGGWAEAVQSPCRHRV